MCLLNTVKYRRNVISECNPWTVICNEYKVFYKKNKSTLKYIIKTAHRWRNGLLPTYLPGCSVADIVTSCIYDVILCNIMTSSQFFYELCTVYQSAYLERIYYILLSFSDSPFWIEMNASTFWLYFNVYQKVNVRSTVLS